MKFKTVCKYAVLIYFIYCIAKLIWAYDLYAGPKAHVYPLTWNQTEIVEQI